jgi:hypothetical protein
LGGDWIALLLLLLMYHHIIGDDVVCTFLGGSIRA